MEKLILEEILDSLVEKDFYIHSPERKKCEQIVLDTINKIQETIPSEFHDMIESQMFHAYNIAETGGFAFGFKYAFMLLLLCIKTKNTVPCGTVFLYI